MIRLINQHDLDAAQSLNEAELIRLRARIAELVSQALREHDRQNGQPDRSLMDLYGAMHSEVPKASDEQVSESIAAHIARENQRLER